MRTFVYIILSLTMVSLIDGCDLADLPINVEPAEEQLVVSSFVGPGPSLLVTVSKSFSALSAADFDSLETGFVERLLVNGAEVILTHNGITDTLFGLTDVPGVYGNFVDVEESDLLDITIYDPDSEKSISASAILLPPVDIQEASIAEEIDSRGDTTTILTYQFDDLPGENFYVLHAYKLPADGSLDSTFVAGDSLNVGAVPKDILFYQTLITDQSFSSSSIADTVRIFQFSVNESIALSLSNISEGYFRFLDAQRRTGGIVSSLVSEPVTHPTNISGGLGYFTAHQPTAIIVEVNR